jgi:RHS repeat-associated protein
MAVPRHPCTRHSFAAPTLLPLRTLLVAATLAGTHLLIPWRIASAQQYGVVVTPFSMTVNIPPFTPTTQTFTVRNSGTSSATYSISASCGSPLVGCNKSMSSVTLSPNQTQGVTVQTTAGADGTTGTIVLSAVYSGPGGFAQAQGLIMIHGQAAGGGGGTVTAGITLMHPGTRLERDNCLDVSMVDASAECGDLRIGHALPSTLRLNKARTPYLTYSSQHAHPYPTVSADITLSSGVPDSVVAVLTVNGVNRARGNWPGSQWTAGSTRRITVGFDGLSDATGVYPFTLEVSMWSGGTRNPYTATSQLVIVNRASSFFGAGWWLGGLETLYPGSMLWIGGDGSTRQYVSAGTNVWATQNIDYPDTLKWDGTYYTRYLPGGLRVQFNSIGQHVQTVNRLSHTTSFGYNGSRLNSITLPLYGGSSGAPYLFYYDGAGMLSQVGAPSATSNGVPQDRTTWVSVSGGQLQNVTDPDGAITRYYYYGAANLITYRTPPGGGTTGYDYDAVLKVRTAWLNPGMGDSLINPHLFTMESRSLAPTALDPAHSYTVFDGARTDVPDSTYFWLDRYGQVTKIQDATGTQTTLNYDDVRWPGRVTKMKRGSGAEQQATYNARGNLLLSSVVFPYGDLRSATTRYEYDNSTWPDFATRIVQPQGDSTIILYDNSTGNRAEETPAYSPISTHFRYYANGQLRAAGDLLTTPDSMEYDGNGNLHKTVSPVGAATTFSKDEIGRDTLVSSPIDGSNTQTTRTVYSVTGLPLTQTSTGPAMNGAGVEQVSVVNGYDAARRLHTVQRSFSPDQSAIGTITTTFDYDTAGRKVIETAPDGAVERTWFDPAGNAIKVQTKRHYEPEVGQQFITATYDTLNRLTSRCVPSVHYGSRMDGIPTDPGASSLYTGVAWSPGYYQHSYPLYPNDNGVGYLIHSSCSTFTYDPLGSIATANNNDAHVTRTYYPNGALHTETQQIANYDQTDFAQHSYTLTYNYDLNGHRIELVHPAQLVAGAALDRTSWNYSTQSGLLASLRDVANNIVSFGYTSHGALSAIGRPGGINEAFSYDAGDRLVGDSVLNGSSSSMRWADNPFRRSALTYDQRDKVTQTLNTVGARGTRTATYSGLGHLLSSDFNAVVPTQAGHSATANYHSNESFSYDGLANVYQSQGYDESHDANGNYSLNPHGTTTHDYAVPNVGRLRQALFVGTSDAHIDTLAYDATGNTAWIKQRYLQWSNTRSDRATYYGLDGKVRATDSRTLWHDSQNQNPPPMIYTTTFEEYRYDALGRRVWVRARQWCQGNYDLNSFCQWSKVRRVIWDGSQELYEIQMPDSIPDFTQGVATRFRENDTSLVVLGLYQPSGTTFPLDPNLFFGRVAYASDGSVDRPLSVVRFGYVDAMQPYQLGQPLRGDTARLAPFGLLPLWNTEGQAEAATVADGGLTVCNAKTCAATSWPLYLTAYGQESNQIHRRVWHGSLLEDKADASGLKYRRNRMYDPSTGQFTQEDPIGLAGGMNAYGFAGGDPVNFSDPFGLCTDPQDPKCAQGTIVSVGASGGAAFGPGANGSVSININTTTGYMNVSAKAGGSIGMGLTSSIAEGSVTQGTLEGVSTGNEKDMSLAISSPFASVSQSFDTKKNWARNGLPTVGYGPTKFGVAVMLNSSPSSVSTPAINLGPVIRAFTAGADAMARATMCSAGNCPH